MYWLIFIHHMQAHTHIHISYITFWSFRLLGTNWSKMHMVIVNVEMLFCLPMGLFLPSDDCCLLIFVAKHLQMTLHCNFSNKGRHSNNRRIWASSWPARRNQAVEGVLLYILYLYHNGSRYIHVIHSLFICFSPQSPSIFFFSSLKSLLIYYQTLSAHFSHSKPTRTGRDATWTCETP